MSENITPITAHNNTQQTKQADKKEGLANSYNFEIEQGLLGALMVNNTLYDHISDFLKAPHFYDPLHSKIFEIIISLVNNNEPATAITLRAFFENDKQMEKRGGVRYLISLEGAASTLVNSMAWARAIQNHSQRRELMKLGQEIYDRALSHNIDNPPPAQIEQAESALYEIAEHGSYEAGMQSFGQSLMGAMEMAEDAHKLSASGSTIGIATGLRDLDDKLGTLRASDLIVLAGRPAMGKTALATNIAFNIARRFQQEQTEGSSKSSIVAFFSLEMSAEQLSMRILASRARVPAHYIRQGNLRDNDFERLKEASSELNQLPLYIDHTGAIPLPTLAARARRLKRQKGLGLIVVDYLQLVTIGGGSRNLDRRVQEVSQVTQGLKALAKDLDVPVIALSQLSRQVENRDDKRPQLSDLRESGAIEQDADIVLFLFREEYYKNQKKPEDESSEAFEKWTQEMVELEGRAEIIIGKHRHGPTGSIELMFERDYTNFVDLAPIGNEPEYNY